MLLETDAGTVDAPTKAAVLAAIPDRAPSRDWSLYLERGDGEALEAEGLEDGRFEIARFEKGAMLIADRPMAAADLRRLFEQFYDDAPNWKRARNWSPPANAATPGFVGGSSASVLSRIGPWLGVIPVAAVAIYSLWDVFFPGSLPAIPSFDWPDIDIPLPAAIDSTPAKLILGFFALCVLVFLIAAIVKSVEVRLASRWPVTMGRIIRSERGFAMRQSHDDELPRNEPIADIAFEYKVRGTTLVGHRINLAERIGEDEIDGFLALYPVGKEVKVYVNPTNPIEAVLDRAAPKGIAFGCFLMLVFGVLGVLGVMWAVTNGGPVIKSVLPNSEPAVMAIPGIVGIGFLLAFIAGFRSASQAKRWPTTRGIVTLSDVVSYETRDKRSNGKGYVTRTGYRPNVEYEFSVGGRTYRSRSIVYQTEEGGSKRFAERKAARYPKGKSVEVRYNPANPKDAALEVKVGFLWLLLPISAGCFAFAAAFSGLF
jgi:hypothetical protein